MSINIRSATANDQDAILSLARGERVKPIGLTWPNFMVAEWSNQLVGMVQLRRHSDGSRELGTLVVRRDCRNKGIAAMLIDALLVNQTGRIFMITSAAHADHYRRWGFAPIEARSAPGSICCNYWLGRYGGRIISLFQGRASNPLAILDRATPLTPPAARGGR
jgi:amino-acid N-acetyltransferase